MKFTVLAPSFRRVPVLFGFSLFASIIFLVFQIPRSAASQEIPAPGFPASKNLLQPQSISVTVDTPELSPAYSDLCSSGWLSYTNALHHPAYLALNRNAAAESTNQGEWRPDLPQEGIYLVEAYVPAHSPTDWPCGLNKNDLGDTRSARYQVNHRWGTADVVINQLPLNDQWVSLGSYSFITGTVGTVLLTDVTGETSQTATVSFSAMRFTWQKQLPRDLFLPIAINGESPVTVSQVQTEDPQGNLKRAFLPGEAIRYHGTGNNGTGAKAFVSYRWLQQGGCGDAVIATGNIELPAGSWSLTYQGNAPACSGVFAATLEITFQGKVSEQYGTYAVNYPSQVALTNLPGFDTCVAPTISQMQTWWNSSPYKVANFYLGGSSLYYACKGGNLDEIWVNQVSEQGWTLIPTWVGPQAPCSNYYSRMSSNKSTSYQQGRSEADQAMATAGRFGLRGDRVIYYDLEYYASSDVSTACRDAVEQFMRGWTERLHELGGQSGIYGSPCGSYLADFTTINPMPDNVWIAAWLTPYQYRSNVSLYGVSCLSDSVWNNHQRLRQYAGGHNETWGGLTINIDSDVTDGEVTVLPNNPSLLSAPQVEQVEAFQLVSTQEGWVQIGQRLYWVRGSTMEWQDITPPVSGLERILSAAFYARSEGWALLQDSQAGLALLNTTDGGLTWNQTAWALPGPDIEIDRAWIETISPGEAWVALKLRSGSNFSLGRLFQTRDGGLTWEERTSPIGGPLEFISMDRGWTTGGPAGDAIFSTQDGGRTWQPVELPALDLQPGERALISLPHFPEDSPDWGSLAVTVSGSSGSHLLLLETQDQDKQWSLSWTISLDSGVELAAAQPASATSPGNWFAALPGSGKWIAAASGGISREGTLPFSGTVTGVQFISPSNGWALVQDSRCSGTKLRPGAALGAGETPWVCSSTQFLIQTTDGGENWTKISLASQAPR